jgi:tetratricopeptide (TPR) repeat protein
MEESKVRREEDEQDWAVFEAQIKAETSTEAVDQDALATVELTLTKEANQNKVQTQASATVLPGQDAHESAFRFCAVNDLHSADEVKKISGMLQQRLGPEFEVPEKKVVGDPAGHLERGKEHQKAGRYHEAGSEFSRALASPGVTAEQSAEASQLTVAMMRLQSSMKPFVERFLAHKWEEAVTLLERIPREDRANARGVLMEARCFQQLGRFANAQRAAARVLEAAASYGSWQRGEPRMMAVKLGADAAMEQGNSDKAIKFYKTVLKYDPDQKEIRKQYKKLKSVVKLLEQAEKHVTKGYNHKAVDTLDEILAELRGMDVDSNVFRSTILLKLCRAQASMALHEQVRPRRHFPPVL